MTALASTVAKRCTTVSVTMEVVIEVDISPLEAKRQICICYLDTPPAARVLFRAGGRLNNFQPTLAGCCSLPSL